MLKYDEFQNEKKAILPDIQKSKKKLGRKKEKRLLLKLDQFFRKKKEIEQNTVPPDVGGSNYYHQIANYLKGVTIFNLAQLPSILLKMKLSFEYKS